MSRKQENVFMLLQAIESVRTQLAQAYAREASTLEIQSVMANLINLYAEINPNEIMEMIDRRNLETRPFQTKKAA